ncbi:MAG: GNAT family N-acetyltransferase [Alphaproteobacteria bacterium]|nr:GNAT family N-acetyltransferase [Alphaproteobacteria bacterium]
MTVEFVQENDVRAGDLEVRLAKSEAEIVAAQKLRYKVFYQEMSARPSADTLALGRDADDYDAHCDHLLVIDHSLGDGPAGVVGTYRLIRKVAADKIGRFYSAAEFDLEPLQAYPTNLLELGRSCIDAPYRTRSSMNLLWRGIASYVAQHDIGIMFGCGSLAGSQADLSLPLSYLYYHHLAPAELRPRAVAERRIDMRLLPPEAIDRRRALLDLPPLIKGYLRLGGFVGDGAVFDEQFNTIDVCIIVKTDLITDRYAQHYSRAHRDVTAQS